MRNLSDITEAPFFAVSGKTAVELTSFKGGGSVENLFLPSSAEELGEVVAALNKEGFEPFILGGGSNVIIADGVLKRPVVSTARLKNICVDGNSVYAECGAQIADVIKISNKNGFGGLEFLSGIPASIGGVIKMNAGAFGQQTADYIKEIYTLSRDCVSVDEITVDKNSFSYRNGADGIVLAARFCLPVCAFETAKERARNYSAQRAFKQPRFPSCGSTFKNSTGEGEKSAGLLIDLAGLKGFRCGGAEISEKHANFIINTGGATADDFLSLVSVAETAVFEKFGVRLEREFVLLTDAADRLT